ncbi:hypothetical protein ACIBVL_38740 [Streptomyces sp. NPDC049687]|uniref:hypothetical protein n=1 Tax=Streptomyces sp. NPDC049687 TaxID=3365596 RepID=UPI00379B2880
MDGGRGTPGSVRRPGRAGDTGLRWYAQAEAVATDGERARWHRAQRPTAGEAAANTRPSNGIDQQREARA